MWRLSTALRNALLEYNARVRTAMSDTSISFTSGDGTDGRDTIKDANNGLGEFRVYDMLSVVGSTSNDGHYRVLAVPSAGVVEIPSGSLINESAGAKAILAACLGGSYAGILRAGVIRIFSGSQPASADDGETGTMLCEISRNGATFTPGDYDNGINLGQVSDGTMHKAIDPATGAPEVWSGVGTAACGSSGLTAGWFRFYANDMATGAGTDKIRIDGAIATSGAQLNMSNTTIKEGVTVTIDSVTMPLPENP